MAILKWSDNCEAVPGGGNWDGVVDTMYSTNPPNRIITRETAPKYEGSYSYEISAVCLYEAYTFIDLSFIDVDIGEVLWIDFWLYRQDEIKRSMVLSFEDVLRIRFAGGETIVEGYDYTDFAWEGGNLDNDLGIDTWLNIIVSIKRSVDTPQEPNGLISVYTRTSLSRKPILRMKYGHLNGELYNTYGMNSPIGTLKMGLIGLAPMDAGSLINYDLVRVFLGDDDLPPEIYQGRKPTETSTSSGVMCPFSGIVKI